MDERLRAGLWPLSSRAASFTNDKKRNAETRRSRRTALRSADDLRLFSVGGRFGGGGHAVLGDFVDPASGRLDALAIEMIERDAALANGIALFDGFRHVSFREGSSLEQQTSGSELRGKRGRKGASRAVQGLFPDAIAGQLKGFCAIKEHVVGALHVSAFNDHCVRAHFHDFA